MLVRFLTSRLHLAKQVLTSTQEEFYKNEFDMSVAYTSKTFCIAYTRKSGTCI